MSEQENVPEAQKNEPKVYFGCKDRQIYLEDWMWHADPAKVKGRHADIAYQIVQLLVERNVMLHELDAILTFANNIVQMAPVTLVLPAPKTTKADSDQV